MGAMFGTPVQKVYAHKMEEVSISDQVKHFDEVICMHNRTCLDYLIKIRSSSSAQLAKFSTEEIPVLVCDNDLKSIESIFNAASSEDLEAIQFMCNRQEIVVRDHYSLGTALSQLVDPVLLNKIRDSNDICPVGTYAKQVSDESVSRGPFDYGDVLFLEICEYMARQRIKALVMVKTALEAVHIVRSEFKSLEQNKSSSARSLYPSMKAFVQGESRELPKFDKENIEEVR